MKNRGFQLQLNDYTEQTKHTAIYPEAGTGQAIELYYLALGLTSEAGEVAGKVKKYIRDGVINEEAIAHEIGDCFWYLARLCKAVGYEPETVLEMNITKLLLRKVNNTIQGSGDER
jgi:NTP pyrophosphatase (non-canonical NTP hydrolase)